MRVRRSAYDRLSVHRWRAAPAIVVPGKSSQACRTDISHLAPKIGDILPLAYCDRGVDDTATPRAWAGRGHACQRPAVRAMRRLRMVIAVVRARVGRGSLFGAAIASVV